MTTASVFGATIGLPVAVLRSVVDLDRQPRELLDQELADQRRVPRRAARQDRDALDGLELRVGDLHLLEEHLAGVLRDAAENRLARGGRLLEDLLEHEVLVAGLLRHDRIPEHALRRLGDRPAEEVGERDAGPRDDAISSSPRKTTSRVWLRMAGMSDATKNSPSPRPTTIGGPLRTATIFSGIVGRDQHEREQPAHQQQRAPDGVLEAVVLHLALDEVRDDLGVGFGDEHVALPLQLLLQIEVVLDDAVVDDDDLAGAVAVRVRVLLGRPAVRRPARVADAVVARRSGRR